MMATRFLSSTLKRLSANSRETPDSETAGNAELLEDPSRDEEAFGLFRLYASGSMMDPISELATRSAGPSETVAPYDVDIVAIHGLGGTAYKTWTHDNGRLWLRDFAPIQFPGARIYTFGYDSGIAFSRGTGTVGDFAKILLESIKLERQTPDLNRRPLLLICHSMGGIVAKLAVTIARNDPDNYPGIGRAVTAILFLGTPHQGSPYAGYATTIAKTANFLAIGTQASRFTGKFRTDLLKSLKRHEAELLRIAEDFRMHTADIQIRSFVEGKNMKGLNRRVVDDHSAFVGAATERKIPMAGYDHRNMCRYGSFTDLGLNLILGAVRDCLSNEQLRRVPNVNSRSNPPMRFIKIPFQQNPEFVGQEQILAQLKLILDDAPSDRQVALYGLGGIGKSQVALQYAYSFQKARPNSSIFWVFAGNKESFEQDYMEIAKGLKLPGYDDPEVNVLPLVKNSLEKPNSNDWLMIVDNADDMSLLGDSREAQSSSSSVKVDHQDGLFKYIPNSGAGSILYTTRSKTNALRLTGEGKTIHISEMSIADSKSLLRTKLNGETSDEESWIDLLETVERLPLAIVQAASYIRQNSWSVSKYLRHFHAQEENASIHFLLHDFHDKTRQNTVANPVFKTWIITVQQLEDLHPRAAEALWLMAFYNRQNIPRYLLLKRTGSSSANLVPSDNTEDAHGFGGFHHKTKMNCVTHEIDASSELLFDEAIGTLVAYSFINVAYTENGEKYTLHRLVQTFTRYWLKDYRRTADSWAMKSLYFLVNEFPKAEYEDWTKAAELLPHVQVIHTYQPTSNLPAREFGVLLTAVATYLRTKAQFPMAEDYIHQALAILSEDLGGEDPITMDAWYCLGHIHNGLGRFREAEKTYRLLIDYYSNALGKSHASVFHVASLLSSTLRIQKKYEEAEKLARQSVLGLEVLQDLEVEVLLRSKGVLSTILSDRGQFEESISIRREIVNAAQKEYGSEHPRSLQMQHHLAVTLAKMGEVEEAKAISQYVLILNERIFGPDDPRTINIVFNLALTLTTEGYYAKAEGYFRRVLENRSYYQRGGEVNTIRSMQGLAFCLENQKLYDDAAKYYQTAYDMIQMAPDVKEVDQDEIKDDLARVQGLQSNDTEANEENLIKRLIGSDSEIPQSEDSGIGIGTGGWGGGGGGGEGGGWHCHPSYIDFGN